MEQLDQLWYELLDNNSSQVVVSALSPEDVVIKGYGAGGEFVGEIVEGLKNEPSESN